MVRGPVFALLLLATSRALAAGPAEVTLEAPAGCPDRAAFLELVAQHADGDLPADLDGHVRVERIGARWIATVDRTGAAPRRFEGASCAEVMDAAALVIALAIEVPAPAPEQEPPAGAPPDPVRVVRRAPPDPVRVVRRAPPPASATAMRFRAGAAGDAGTLPGPALAATLSASAWRPLGGLELTLALFRPGAASVSAGDDEVAPVRLWVVGLRACRSISIAALCLGSEAGRISADAGRLAEGEEKGALWSAVTGSAWIRQPIGGAVGLYAGGEVLAAVTRPRFVLDDDTLLHRPAAAGARILIGFELAVR